MLFYTLDLFHIIMVQAFVSFKSGGVAFILAFFFGLFLFNGVGHMYIGKVRRGLGILIIGWFIYSVLVIVLLSPFIPVLMQFYHSNNNAIPANSNTDLIPSRNNSHGNNFSPLSFFPITLFIVLYFLYVIIQAVDANRLAKKFNKHLDKTGELLWH